MKKIKILVILLLVIAILFMNTNTIGKVYADQIDENPAYVPSATQQKKNEEAAKNKNTSKNTNSSNSNGGTKNQSNSQNKSNGGTKTKSNSENIDDVFQDAKDFLKYGENNSPINESLLHDTSNFLYNLLLGIGIILAVIVGVIIGIKYITGSVEEKADLKQVLIGYVVSCVVIFGAFGIWKIVVTALQSM